MSQIELRAVLAETLAAMMEKDGRVCVIDADLAKANGTYGLRSRFPGRAFDVGVAEQNMASIAAGLAAEGMIPFILSFTPFATRRICDQLAVSVCYAGRNVKVIGCDPGLTAELNGGTHMSVEDIGVVRSIPTLVVTEALDVAQLKQALPAVAAHEGPVYLRMFRKTMPDVFDEASYRYDLFKADKLRDGADVSIFAHGLMVSEAQKAVKILEQEGIRADLLSVHTIKPLDEAAVIESAKKTGAVVTCDNHSVIGALGSAVAETLARNCPTLMRMVGIQDRFGQVGLLPFLMEEYQMTAGDIVKAVRTVLTAR